MLFYFALIIIFILILYLFLNKKENWCNTYSGWPGPLESPYQSNIPALYGNPKYMANCEYKSNPKSNLKYFQFKNLPN